MLREQLSKGHVGLVRDPCERQLGVLGMRLFANSLHVSKFATDASSRERMLSNKELASPNKELASLISGLPVSWSQASTDEVPTQVACQYKLRPLTDALPCKLLSG